MPKIWKNIMPVHILLFSHWRPLSRSRVICLVSRTWAHGPFNTSSVLLAGMRSLASDWAKPWKLWTLWKSSGLLVEAQASNHRSICVWFFLWYFTLKVIVTFYFEVAYKSPKILVISSSREFRLWTRLLPAPISGLWSSPFPWILAETSERRTLLPNASFP